MWGKYHFESAVMSEVSCIICEARAQKIFEVLILRKYPRDLYRCDVCGGCFFPNPDWLSEAYSKAISDLDTGIIERGLDIANVVTPFLFLSKLRHASVLDYGGGLGVLARILRDRGFDASSYDPLAESVFSLPKTSHQHFDFVTMVEVFEHLEDPVTTITELSEQTNLIFISTLCIPGGVIDTNWWYLLADTGQHINFPTKSSLETLAKKIGWTLTSNGNNLHLLSRYSPSKAQRFLVKHQRISWLLGFLSYPLIRSRSLTASDLVKKTKEIYKQ